LCAEKEKETNGHTFPVCRVGEQLLVGSIAFDTIKLNLLSNSLVLSLGKTLLWIARIAMKVFDRPIGIIVAVTEAD
jgi:hypothetical protein